MGNNREKEKNEITINRTSKRIQHISGIYNEQKKKILFACQSPIDA